MEAVVEYSVNPMTPGKRVWQVDMIAGLLACINSLYPVCSVVCKWHSASKSFYFTIIFNIKNWRLNVIIGAIASKVQSTIEMKLLISEKNKLRLMRQWCRNGRDMMPPTFLSTTMACTYLTLGRKGVNKKGRLQFLNWVSYTNMLWLL